MAERHVPRRHLLPAVLVHRTGDGSPHDEVRTVVDFLQVFDLAGRQKSPDFIQCPFALDGVLEVALSCGITASNHEKYFSGDEQGHLAAYDTATGREVLACAACGAAKAKGTWP